MTRIAYFVHGRGKGHAVRTQAVLERLRGSDELRLFCAGRAFDVLHYHPASEQVLTYAPRRGMARSFALRLRVDRQRLRDCFEAELEKDRADLAARTLAMRPASEVVPRVIDALCRPAPVTNVPWPCPLNRKRGL